MSDEPIEELLERLDDDYSALENSKRKPWVPYNHFTRAYPRLRDEIRRLQEWVDYGVRARTKDAKASEQQVEALQKEQQEAHLFAQYLEAELATLRRTISDLEGHRDGDAQIIDDLWRKLEAADALSDAAKWAIYYRKSAHEAGYIVNLETARAAYEALRDDKQEARSCPPKCASCNEEKDAQ